MFRWDENRIRWMQAAAERGRYHEELAARIGHYVRPDAHLCDAGCGLGFLSLALSGYVRCISAVDLAPEAIDTLKRNILLRGVTNIEPVVADMNNFTPATPFDAAVFCYYGQMRDVLPMAKRICSGTVVFIKSDTKKRGIASGGGWRMETVSDAAAVLDGYGVAYTRERLLLEYGQPFDTLQDAGEFFKNYYSGEYSGGLESVVEVKDRSYRYYLPYEKAVGMLVFRTADIPDIGLESEENHCAAKSRTRTIGG